MKTRLLVLVGLLVAAPATAQQPANPHGRLPAGLDCGACHTVQGWKPVRAHLAFDHASTGFPLSGRHQAVPCAQCHLGLRFDQPGSAGADCASCHVDVHRGRLGTVCTDCHNTRAFGDVRGAAVHQRTAFPLTGAHLVITCESCHRDERGGAFSPLPTDCYSCHRRDYENTRSVDHVAAGFPTTCERCHTTVSFTQNAVFDHVTASNGYPLVGAHARLECRSCHNPSTSQPIFHPANANDCITCHQANFQSAHGNTGFPQTCLSCHNQDSWGGATFDHTLVSSFALLGAHASLPCTACHQAKTLTPLFHPANQNDCYACHQPDYQRVHAGKGFPTTCADCHNVNQWGDATFDHAAVSGFALVGAHVSLPCTACHDPNTAQSLFQPADQNDCYSCHKTDYQNNHAGTGFPTTCLTCHTVDTWSGATFTQHDNQYFPIYSGAHAGQWASCATCHTVPADFTQFTCLVCHAHDQATTDSHHQGVSGYVYESGHCYSCHPRGRAGD